MEESRPTRILVVANRTSQTPRLLEEVRRRAQAATCEFELLVPPVGRRRSDWTLESALPLFRRVARGKVSGIAAGPDSYASVRDAVRGNDFDEIIISTPPARSVSRRLHRDLFSRTARLGVPVTALVPRGRGMSNKDAAKMMLELGGTGPFG